VKPALEWILALARGYECGIRRDHRCSDRRAKGIYLEFDASPWGGGGLVWDGQDAKKRGDPPLAFWSHKWTRIHEVILGAKIGDPGSQTIWEAFALFLSVKMWVTEDKLGPIIVVGDAEGVIYDIVQLRGRSPSINRVAKEVALLLAPQGRDLQGLHIWGERSTFADMLSRREDGSYCSLMASLHASSTEVRVPSLTAMNLRFLGAEP
jgi:hypothetical protein